MPCTHDNLVLFFPQKASTKDNSATKILKRSESISNSVVCMQTSKKVPENRPAVTKGIEKISTSTVDKCERIGVSSLVLSSGAIARRVIRVDLDHPNSLGQIISRIPCVSVSLKPHY